MHCVAAVLALTLLPPPVCAAHATLDPSFGVGGVVEISWPAGPASARAVGLDPAGRILVGGSAAGPWGNADFALFRLQPDGTLDTTYAADGGGFRLLDFNLDGIGGRSDDAINDLAMYPDGALVALGEAHFGIINSRIALARVDAGGHADPGFGTAGLAHFGAGSIPNVDYGRAVLLDAQQRILTVSLSARPHDMTLQLDWWFDLARLTPQGRFDATFFAGGSYTNVFWSDPTQPPPLRHSGMNLPTALRLDAANRIVVAGRVAQPMAPDAALYRAAPDGDAGPPFGQYSRVRLGLDEGQATALAALPDGGMMVAGGCALDAGTYGLFLARLRDDGSPDPAFGVAGIATVPLADRYPEPSLLAPTRDGGWLVAGRLNAPLESAAAIVIARFDAHGQPLAGFGDAGVATIGLSDGRPFDAGRALLQADGKLVVAGSVPALEPDTTPHFAVLRIVVEDGVFADGFEARVLATGERDGDCHGSPGPVARAVSE